LLAYFRTLITGYVMKLILYDFTIIPPDPFQQLDFVGPTLTRYKGQWLDIQRCSLHWPVSLGGMSHSIGITFSPSDGLIEDASDEFLPFAGSRGGCE
jgi:hypothetical protein